MSKKISPTEEGQDTPKNCVEIPLPELVDDSFEKGRVFHYGTARWAYGFLLFIIIACVLIAATELPDGLFLVSGFLLLPTLALLLISKYEISHDREGFSVCLGKRVLHRYSWSEVTGVDVHMRVFVNGKKLFAEPSMSGYEAFYDRAHAACKRKRQPKPTAQALQVPPKPTEEKDESPESKGYIEIDLSRLKDKLDDGYDHKLTVKGTNLSGGQKQRLLIARALAGNPPVILADEPTGALDSKTGKDVLDFLKKLHSEGTTIVLITHDIGIASQIPRVVRIHDGQLVSDEQQEVFK